MYRTLALTLLSSLAISAYTTAADADQYPTIVQKKATSILEEVKKKGYKNIGVLKFLVRQGEGPLSDDAGDLNLTLANKTEVALILANTDDTFGIIDKASEAVVREKLTIANHKTDEGRQAFFLRKYELAWSRDKVVPSVFLTGSVTLSQDLKSMTIKLQIFDKSGTLVDLPGEITAATDPELLAQAGFSYTLPPATRTALVSGKATPEVAKKEAVETMKNSAPEPMAAAKEEPFAPLAESPVQLEIRYNNSPVKVKGNVIAEPKAMDRVSFVLKNPGPGTYAVVMLVNGENTLYQEKVDPLACRKWVLEPNTEVVVHGFQVDDKTVAPFRVTKPDEPIEDAVRYGPHAGTFRMVVFAGTMSTEPIKSKPPQGDLASRLAIANTRGGTNTAKVKPQTLEALQADLRGRSGGDGSRGYLVKGNEREKFETQSVYFVPTSDLAVTDVSLKYVEEKK